MEKLKELHAEVKNHVFRKSQDEKHLESYTKLLKEFMNEFREELDDHEQYRDIKYNIASFHHDFNSAKLSMSFGNTGSKNIQHIEQCISCVHKFIEHGKVIELWTYYTGCNKYDSTDRMRQYLWHEEKREMVPQYRREELNDLIKEIEDNLKEDGITGMYSQEALDYYKELKVSGDYLMHIKSTNYYESQEEE